MNPTSGGSRTKGTGNGKYLPKAVCKVMTMIFIMCHLSMCCILVRHHLAAISSETM
jgi:hypothetical protein